MDMFFHIASIEREVYWQLGNVVCSAYPLKNLDTIHSEVFTAFYVSREPRHSYCDVFFLCWPCNACSGWVYLNFNSEFLHWLGVFKCLILTTNERVGWWCKMVWQTYRKTYRHSLLELRMSCVCNLKWRRLNHKVSERREILLVDFYIIICNQAN